MNTIKGTLIPIGGNEDKGIEAGTTFYNTKTKFKTNFEISVISG
jgi:hypothetical protein